MGIRHVVVQLTPFDFAFRPFRFARHRGRTAAGISMSTQVRSQCKRPVSTVFRREGG